MEEKQKKPLRRKYYFFRGTFWRTGIMSYDDSCNIKALISDHFIDPRPEGFQQIIDELMDKGALKEGFNIFLKPVFPFAIWNRIVMAIQGKSWNERIRLLDTDEITGVLVDFFYLNVSWISSYFSFAFGLDLKTWMENQIMKSPLSGKNPPSLSQTETSR